ncbi:MAG: NAD-dependent epimerase/dehydratase family protein [Terracidiphilus sp.]
MTTEYRDSSTDNRIIGKQELILVTGAAGFIGAAVVRRLLEMGFTNLRCLVRTEVSAARLRSKLADDARTAAVEVLQGNLLSREDCRSAASQASVVLHLAAGRGEKSYPDAYMNSVVTTRNLIEASLATGRLKRFVNVSSFSVYTNRNKKKSRLLDESCPVDERPERRGEAYTFAKAKQDEMVMEYGKNSGLPFVIVRPGHVYGPGNEAISGRVGIDTFGIFLHMGGWNTIPFTYVDNCAEAIVLAGIVPGVEREVFNVVDDDPMSSRRFLRQYKKNVGRFRSFYVPHLCSYLLCWIWEWYSAWSQGQLPPAFNRRRWSAFWKSTSYSNRHIKDRLGWKPAVSMQEGMRRYFEACRARGANA